MNFLITGLPGSGKSTLVKELIKELEVKKKIAGIITPEIREQGIRKGFKIIDLRSKEERVMASVNFKPAIVSKYGVSVENIDYIVDKFLESFDGAEIYIIDEVGKMEFFSKKFRALIDKVFSSGKLVIAVLHRSQANKFREHGEVIIVERGRIAEIKREILENIL